jgi:hypothetical protein
MTRAQLSREAPLFNRPVVAETYSPGGAANVAWNLADLGVGEVHAITVLGADWRGSILRDIFHRLRIQMKRLRYACEFVGPAYDGALDPFIERTVEIQDCLGELQDTVFTREFVDSLRADWQGKLVDPDLLFVLGEIYQLQAEIARERRKQFADIWERFSSEETIGPLWGILNAQPEEEVEGKYSGFKECWKNQLKWNDKNFEESLIFELWRYGKKQELMDDGIYFLKDIPKERLGKIIPEKDGSLSSKERQWLQIEKVKKNDPSPYVNIDGLKEVFKTFIYPLHFIDFETNLS